MPVALAALFGRSLTTLRAVNLGFADRGVIAFTVDLPDSWKRMCGRSAAPDQRKGAGQTGRCFSKYARALSSGNSIVCGEPVRL